MSKDILTIRQLQDQLGRRQERLRQLIESSAPETEIKQAQKDLQLTRRRLERAKAADYDEELMDVQEISHTEK